MCCPAMQELSWKEQEILDSGLDLKGLQVKWTTISTLTIITLHLH